MISEKNLDYLVEASARFREEAEIPPLDNAREYFAELHKKEGLFSIIEHGKGFIVGFATPSFLNPEIGQCIELGWWVEPEHRKGLTAIRLLKGFEEEAKRFGVKETVMAVLEGLDTERTKQIYEKLGYLKYETHYKKEMQ